MKTIGENTMSDYTDKFLKAKIDAKNHYVSLPEIVIDFIAMLDSAKMGEPYSFDERIKYDVSVSKDEVTVKSYTDEVGFVFNRYTGQLLYCYNWKK